MDLQAFLMFTIFRSSLTWFLLLFLHVIVSWNSQSFPWLLALKCSSGDGRPSSKKASHQVRYIDDRICITNCDGLMQWIRGRVVVWSSWSDNWADKCDGLCANALIIRVMIFRSWCAGVSRSGRLVTASTQRELEWTVESSGTLSLPPGNSPLYWIRH